jgi:hypothetical protein
LKATKGGNSHSSVEKAFSYIPRIAYNKKRDREHPEYAELFYIRGILKNRMPLNSAEWYDAILYMEKALANGVETETIKNIAMKSDTFMYFLNALEGEYLQ